MGAPAAAVAAAAAEAQATSYIGPVTVDSVLLEGAVLAGPRPAAAAESAAAAAADRSGLDVASAFFISWQSDSGQEIQRKLLLSNKFLATQAEMARRTAEEVLLAQ